MERKARTLFFCTACGNEAARWFGRCPACNEWNTCAQAPAVTKKGRAKGAGAARAESVEPRRLADIGDESPERISSGFAEFDRVLGGGIVPGSLVLVGGPPGIGKSTLLLQMAAAISGAGRTAMYASGEESAGQVTLRARRLGLSGELLIFTETNLRSLIDALEAKAPAVAIVDSIQTMMLPELDSFAGSVAQIRDSTAELMHFAKRTGCTIFLVGHVTKEGTIAGPRLLEHLVDTVLYFEAETGEHRIIRAHKNRYGNTDEICVFTMQADGLHEVANPSQLFLGHAGSEARPSGACVIAGIVGSRPVLLEVQALVGESAYGSPRRLAANLDHARLSMIVAILERRAGLLIGSHDIYASVAGGLRVDEPAADLGIALAIASSLRNRALPDRAAVFGELGLSGEVRPVTHGARRIAEARRLGFTQIVAPAGSGDGRGAITEVRDIASAIRACLD
jgi:DNA repair protein RadA/Sms